MDELRQRQIAAVKYLDLVVEELFDLVPKNTYITITSDHGELFGEDGYFGHATDSASEGAGSSICRRKTAVNRFPRPIPKCSARDIVFTFGVIALCGFFSRHGHYSAQMAYIGPGSGFAFIRLVSHPDCWVLRQRTLFLKLALPHRMAYAGPPQRISRRARKEGNLPGARRSRSAPDRALYCRRQDAESKETRRIGQLSPAPNDISGAFPGRVVNVRHRRQPGQT